MRKVNDVAKWPHSMYGPASGHVKFRACSGALPHLQHEILGCTWRIIYLFVSQLRQTVGGSAWHGRDHEPLHGSAHSHSSSWPSSRVSTACDPFRQGSPHPRCLETTHFMVRGTKPAGMPAQLLACEFSSPPSSLLGSS